MVSAARLQKAQEEISNSRLYAQMIRVLIEDILWRYPHFNHPLLEQENTPEKSAPDKKDRTKSAIVEKIPPTTIIGVASDRGLCGGFNQNVFRTVEQVLQELDEEDYSLILVGKKGEDYFRPRHIGFSELFAGVLGSYDFSFASEFSEKLKKSFMGGETRRILFIYNRFYSALHQEVKTEQLFPVPRDHFQMDEEVPPDFCVPYEDRECIRSAPMKYAFDPSPERIFETLLERYVKARIHRIFLESRAGDHGARMTAMDNASRNAEEMIEDLTLEYNQARQAAITRELIEIVSGAEALKK